MIVGVIGSGSIGPDLAYGFLNALSRVEGAKVYLNDINPDALAAGVARIEGYLKKGVSNGKLSEKAAGAVRARLCPTLNLADLAGCEYVLEAATERLPLKRALLAQVEAVVGDSCLIGFATSGIPRAEIARDARVPERCFVNHPFFPAWRSLPIEVVGGGDEGLTARMLSTITRLGKVPVLTTDVPCFAADDIFCNYISEAARIVAEGVANPAQVDRIVNEAVGGGGPFNVMDLTRGNLLTAHCQELMRDAVTGGAWFEPPALLTAQGNTPWHDRKSPLDSTYTEEVRRAVLDRVLAVLFGRTFFVLDYGVCDAADLDWMTRTALGFSVGILSLAREWGMERVASLCEAYAAAHPGFEVTESVRARRAPKLYPNLRLSRPEEGVAVVTIQRPEAKNALNAATLADLREVVEGLMGDASVRGVVLTGYEGALAGADINELAALKTHGEAEALCLRGQGVLNYLEGCPKPIIAAVGGPVMGGGAELSMACHARVVSPDLTMSQPEVNLGIIPGYGGTQRLPRLVGVERAWGMLRTGEPIGAREALEWGWADAVSATPESLVSDARALLRAHLKGERSEARRPVGPVSQGPCALPEGGLSALPAVTLGHRSLAIDALLVDVLRRGLAAPLAEGLAIEADGVGRAVETVDCDIGMKNFMQNGPRVPALFLHE